MRALVIAAAGIVAGIAAITAPERFGGAAFRWFGLGTASLSALLWARAWGPARAISRRP